VRRTAAGIIRAGFAAIALLVILPAMSPASNANTPRRIVSLHLCADQYLLALGQGPQIAALSPYAHDRTLSFMAPQADRYPDIRAAAEVVVRFKPDLALAGPFTSAPLRRALVRQGIEVLELAPVTSIAGLRRQIARISAALGAPERGDAMVARLDAALARLRDRGAGVRTLYLQRRGIVMGSDTLLGAIFRRAGLINAAARFGVTGVRRIGLEAIVRSKPQLLILNDRSKDAEDQGSALLHHPAIARLARGRSRIVLPVREIVCPGPATIAAITRLARALAARY